MTSPDLIRELQQSRPTAPDSLRARVQELSVHAPSARHRSRLRLPSPAFVLVPAAAALVLAIGTAGVVSLAGPSGEKTSGADQSRLTTTPTATQSSPQPSYGTEKTPLPGALTDLGMAPVGPTPGRAQDVEATLTVKVADSDHVSRAAQDALDLTRSLGGHVLSASVTAGEDANANLTARIPVAKTQEAVTRLSALGTIVSQHVSIQDLQERLDALLRHARSLRAQIVRITAKLESEHLSAEERAALELRRQSLRSALRSYRQDIRSTRSVARFSTIQLSVVTPASQGVVVPPSRLGRSLDKALDVLVWEGIAALVVLLIAAPLAVLAVAAWLASRIYRRHEDERLLATS
jgi:Domain of unknown function (DUF4349)